MRTITRRTSAALAVLAATLPLAGPAAPAPAPDAGGGPGGIRVTELGGADEGILPLDVNLRTQVLERSPTTVFLSDRGRRVIVSPPPPDARFQPYTATLNDRGDVAGTLMLTSFPTVPVPANARPYLWSGGRHVDLGLSEGFVAYDVNDRRQVLLAAYPFGRQPDQVWDGGEIVSAPVPDDAFRASFVALNDAGTAVGTVDRIVSSRAAVWRVGGGITELGTLGGDTSSGGWISETGAVFGQSTTTEGLTHAFVWRNGRMRDLGTLGGASTWIRRVDAAGDVIGESDTAAGERHGFLWRGGDMADLGPVSFDFRPVAVNVWGQVLGCSFSRELQQQRLWLRQGDRKVDLTELAGGVAAACDSAGINDRGQIVAAVADPTTRAARGVMWTVPPLWGYA
jgi:probable HAF family extracellular repeat protein